MMNKNNKVLTGSDNRDRIDNKKVYNDDRELNLHKYD
jgi:hypothetical protein